MIIASAFGVKIIRKDGSLYARYDRGEIVPDFVDVEITQDECERIQKSENDAYSVLLETQNQNRKVFKATP